jgi:hypothetical protein
MNSEEEARIASLLDTMWERNLPLFHQRLDVLDRVASEASAGDLSEASRLEALSIAHKLSGTLGMFGRHQGTEIARQIELILSHPTPPVSSDLAALTISLRQLLFGN